MSDFDATTRQFKESLYEARANGTRANDFLIKAFEDLLDIVSEQQKAMLELRAIILEVQTTDKETTT